MPNVSSRRSSFADPYPRRGSAAFMDQPSEWGYGYSRRGSSATYDWHDPWKQEERTVPRHGITTTIEVEEVVSEDEGAPSPPKLLESSSQPKLIEFPTEHDRRDSTNVSTATPDVHVGLGIRDDNSDYRTFRITFPAKSNGQNSKEEKKIAKEFQVSKKLDTRQDFERWFQRPLEMTKTILQRDSGISKVQLAPTLFRFQDQCASFWNDNVGPYRITVVTLPKEITRLPNSHRATYRRDPVDARDSLTLSKEEWVGKISSDFTKQIESQADEYDWDKDIQTSLLSHIRSEAEMTWEKFFSSKCPSKPNPDKFCKRLIDVAARKAASRHHQE
ncbi:uncharacterized protein IL334_007908 [Kwoniella shivajii]|uniref:Uncharacterized protein n=1 Tax=Kwoniella shivajii TaxID=564305 RepID=A0ABZ1DC84_9TREE|nr:hypothetical protein IL334_007908 [Kwoniella shivajii]